MKVNYFDLGLYKGVELGWMVNEIFPNLDIQDYNAYGFEANPQLCENVCSQFKGKDKVKIYNYAINKENKPLKLYLGDSLECSSIYDTNKNINRDQSFDVSGVKFSSWLKENVEEFENSFNIIRVNIEGAEWDLMNDLDENNLIGCFNIYCGSFNDVKKVGELHQHLKEYRRIFKKNNIKVRRFKAFKPRNNYDIEGLIKQLIGE